MTINGITSGDRVRHHGSGPVLTVKYIGRIGTLWVA